MSTAIDTLVIGIICVSIALGYMLGAAAGWLIFGSGLILMGLIMVIASLIKNKRHD